MTNCPHCGEQLIYITAHNYWRCNNHDCRDIFYPERYIDIVNKELRAKLSTLEEKVEEIKKAIVHIYSILWVGEESPSIKDILQEQMQKFKRL